MQVFVGMCTFKRRRLLGGGMENYDFKLQISTQIDLSECELEDAIIHEMTLLYRCSSMARHECAWAAVSANDE